MKQLFFPLFVLSTSLLQAEEAPGFQNSSFMQTLIMLGLAVLFFYFILLRPEQKRRKALESLRTSLKVGDKVVAMGIVGSVHALNKDTVVLSMVDGSKIEFLKGAVTDIAPSEMPK